MITPSNNEEKKIAASDETAIDTTQEALVGTDSGEKGALIQFEYVLDKRKAVGVPEEQVMEIIRGALTQQFRDKCISNNWFPSSSADRPDYTISEQDWDSLPGNRKKAYAKLYKISKNHARVFRIVGFVVPRGNAAPLPSDAVTLDTYAGIGKA